MRSSIITSAALLLASATALPQGHWGSPSWGHGGKSAVYFLSVDPAGSSVVAIELDENGMLTDSTSVTSTDGDGLQSQNATSPTLAPTAIDPLQGQDAVVIGDDVRNPRVWPRGID
jgi:hypothetical protein